MTNLAKVKATVILQFIVDALAQPDKRYVVLEGSTRSSKTYSLCQAFILHLHNNPGCVIRCFRKEEKNHIGTTQKTIREVITSLKRAGVPLRLSENRTDKAWTF